VTDADTLNTLRRDGISFTPYRMPPDTVKEIREYLAPLRVWANAHVRRLSGGLGPTTEDLLVEGYHGNSLACYDLATAVRAPMLLPYALSLAPLAEEYLEHEPVLYSMNIWWALPAGNLRPETQAWHRDSDDTKFVVVFFYLTPVDTDGQHQYIVGSHRDEAMQPSEERTITYGGPAGTVFVEDGRGLHRGLKPEKRPRLAAWARFGVSDHPLSYGVDGLEPCEASWSLDERERRICRLIVKGDIS
jgi:hypothetical protein